MPIEVYSAAATEPLTASEVKTYCRIDVSNQEPAPGAVTAALAATPAAGSVDNGAHRYLVVFVTADGKTEAGAVSAAITVADKTVNGQIELSAIPLGGALVTSRELYRTAADGSTYLLLDTLADNTTATYTDNVADADLGAEAPSTNTTADPLIGTLIASARAAAELELRRKLITQTLDAYFDAFPAFPNERFATPRCFLLPPLQSVTSITYYDTDGVEQTLAADQYTVDAISEPARIEPAYGVTWPGTREQMNAVKVRFVAGYGDAADVPACVRNWMLMRIKTLWENRDQLIVGAGGLIEIPPAFIDGLLDPERVRGRTSA